MHKTAPATVGRQTGCVEFAALFQDPILEEPPTSAATREDRSRYQMLSRKADNVCAECPLMVACLTRAVTEYDVAGFVAGTTARQRQLIRQRLQITVQPEDFDTLAGVTARHRQVNHDEVVRLRAANPHESLETLARRLGCSLSTIKRHLRKERSAPSTPKTSRPKPTTEAVLDAYAVVTGRGQARQAA